MEEERQPQGRHPKEDLFPVPVRQCYQIANTVCEELHKYSLRNSGFVCSSRLHCCVSLVLKRQGHTTRKFTLAPPFISEQVISPFQSHPARERSLDCPGLASLGPYLGPPGTGQGCQFVMWLLTQR